MGSWAAGVCYSSMQGSPSSHAIRCHTIYQTIPYGPYYTIPYYTIPYYTILYYTILYYTILYYTMLYYTILYYTILYYTILYYTILYYTILYYTILWCAQAPVLHLRHRCRTAPFLDLGRHGQGCRVEFPGHVLDLTVHIHADKRACVIDR